MTKTIKPKNPFTLCREHYTNEQWKKIKRRQKSKEQAVEFLFPLFGRQATWVMVANIYEQARRQTGNGCMTFEEAWATLDYQTTIDTIFRAIAGLPCRDKDTGELKAYLKEINHD
ncbi:hypothetical protein [Streptococcus sp. zg-JUN1979]|uniref:hypothetical protein n=1 Tax=Streptococcus sp. zg-JUN1979 TaxID=3391450 RepID=UPI0039A63401